MNSYIIKLKKK